MKLKKFMSMLIATAMLATTVSIGSFSTVSAVDTYATSGTCGDDARWILSDDGTLTITGTGEVTNTPKFKFSYDVTRLVVDEGITQLPNSFATDILVNSVITELILPSTLEKLNGFSFRRCSNTDVYIYSRNITDVTQFSSSCLPKPGSGTVMHLYKDSNTETCFRSFYDYTSEDIVYIEGERPEEPEPEPAVIPEITDTSGPSGLNSKWRWDDLSKTLTFSGKGSISIGDDYKKYAKETEHIVIEEGITNISTLPNNWNMLTYANQGAFYGFTALKDVEIPDTLITIGSFAFYQASLTNINISLPSTLEYIGYNAFAYASLEEVSFPNSLKEIGESAFRNCSKLKSINFHDKGMTIGGGAFNSCESLKEVTIPKNVTFGRVLTGGNGMSRNPVTFANCTGLEKIVIEDGGEVAANFGNVSSQNGIVEGFCQNCTNLKTVVIKGNVDYIPLSAFGGIGSDGSGGCPSLTDIYLYNTGLTTITAKDYHDKNNVYYDSFDTRNNPTFHIKKGSTTEKTLKDAGYLTTENTKYLASEFTAIEEKITEAEKDIESGKYTDESVDILKEVLDSGKELLENAKSGYPNIVHQEDIDKAVTDIENAIRGLKVDPAAPGTTRNPDDVKKDKKAAEKIVKQAKITKLKAKSKAKKRITVSWKKVRKAKGYQVQISKKKNFKKKLINKFTTKNKITIKKKIKSGKTYFVRVRAYATYVNTNGNIKKVYSKWNKKLRKVEVK